MNDVRNKLRKPEEKDIDGILFSVGQLNSTEAAKLTFRLANLLGESVLVDISNEDAEALLKKYMSESVGLSILSKLMRLQFDDFDYVCKLFSQQTAYSEDSGQTWLPMSQVNFDEVFAGKLDTELKWLQYSFERTFKSFLSFVKLALAGLGRTK